MSGKGPPPPIPPREFKPRHGQATTVASKETKSLKIFNDMVRDIKYFKHYLYDLRKYHDLDKFKSVINISRLLENMTLKYYDDKDFNDFLKDYKIYGITIETMIVNGVPDIILSKSEYSTGLIGLFDNNLLYVKALKYRDSSVINKLYENNINIACFTKDFNDKYNECREHSRTQKECIQKAIDNLFIQNMFKAFNGTPNIGCIDLLLQIDRRNYINMRNEYGGMYLTPLGIAIHTKNTELTKHLLDFRPRFDDTFNTRGTSDKYLDIIVKNNDVPMLKLLLSAGLGRHSANADIKVLQDNAKNNTEMYNLLRSIR